MRRGMSVVVVILILELRGRWAGRGGLCGGVVVVMVGG